ncbi:MAG TPA: DUF5335 family protein [Blastocatellia bacterium]|nr:DUF5335 family protein [Blastocatellia bacterium]
MPTQEIPTHEWERFFNEFSRRHRGWLVTIELLQSDLGDQIQAQDLPLEGITLEATEVGEYDIIIMAGASPDARISHTVAMPRRVWVKQNDEGADEALEIESFTGAVLVRFRSAVLSEAVDDILAEKAKA